MEPKISIFYSKKVLKQHKLNRWINDKKMLIFCILSFKKLKIGEIPFELILKDIYSDKSSIF